MMRVWEGHPQEPILLLRQRVEPGDGAVCDPIGVVQLARNIVVPELRQSGIAATARTDFLLLGDVLEIAVDRVGMVFGQPFRVVEQAASGAAGVAGKLHVLEAAMRSGLVIARGEILEIALVRRRGGLEMRLADQGGTVAGLIA